MHTNEQNTLYKILYLFVRFENVNIFFPINKNATIEPTLQPYRRFHIIPKILFVRDDQHLKNYKKLNLLKNSMKS